MCSCGRNSFNSACCCCCGCGCGCDSDDEITTLPSFPDSPVFPGLAQFPVYVSYPAFFAGDTSINGANIALFANSSSGSARSRRCRG